MMRALVFSLFLHLASTAAVAKEPSLQGVWAGTVGTKPIVACFNELSPHGSYGSYYYVNHLVPIALSTRAKELVWNEVNDTGQWTLFKIQSGKFTAQWRHPKTGQTLPINMEIVDGSDDEPACARDSFNKRLESKPKIEKGKTTQFSKGRSYQELRFAGQSTVELFGLDPALSKINSQIKLDQSNATIQSFFDQRREFLGRVGSPAVDEVHTEPTYWDANFITISFYVWAAGTGRAGISTDYRTWSTLSGQEIDLWTWIGSNKASAKLPAKLKKFLYATLQKQDLSADCNSGYRGEGNFTLLLSKKGLKIEEDAWGTGCEKSFFVEYEKLKPFFTPPGLQGVRAILGQ